VLLCRPSKGAKLTGENHKGPGFLNGKQMGNRWGEMEMGRSVYEQPGTRVDGSYRSKECFQVSKGDQEREQKGISKGR
jgi:hypothetical protein